MSGLTPFQRAGLAEVRRASDIAIAQQGADAWTRTGRLCCHSALRSKRILRSLAALGLIETQDEPKENAQALWRIRITPAGRAALEDAGGGG